MQSKKTKKISRQKKLKSTFNLKHWFVPHKGNKYHPHIIRWQGLVLTAAVSLTTHMVYGYVTTGQFAVLGNSVTISTSSLVEYTNQQRIDKGLGVLQPDSRLNEAATKKAEDMISNNYWSHNSPSGVSPWYWIEQSGYSYSIAGENLAKNYSDARSVVDAWMISSAHRDNILNPKYTSVGFAVVEGVIDAKINTIVVAYYAAPSSGVASVKGDSTALESSSTTAFSNPIVYIGGSIKNMSPVTIGVLAFMSLMIVAAGLAHLSRHYLPKSVKNTWKRHHGLYKAMGISIAATLLIILSSGSYI